MNEEAMREILYRGKCLKDGKWAEGHYFYDPGSSSHIIRVIANISPCWDAPCGDTYIEDFEINPLTRGQYIGIKDDNDVMIFEGDMVRAVGGMEHQGCYEIDITGQIKYTGTEFSIVDEQGVHYSFGYCPIDKIEVIGNIYE
jgi:uncharacterized phage protein (TIGR01671 family)